MYSATFKQFWCLSGVTIPTSKIWIEPFSDSLSSVLLYQQVTYCRNTVDQAIILTTVPAFPYIYVILNKYFSKAILSASNSWPFIQIYYHWLIIVTIEKIIEEIVHKKCFIVPNSPQHNSFLKVDGWNLRKATAVLQWMKQEM